MRHELTAVNQYWLHYRLLENWGYLTLAKKLIAINPDLAAELQPLQKEIRRRDGKGSLMILPAHDVAGSGDDRNRPKHRG